MRRLTGLVLAVAVIGVLSANPARAQAPMPMNGGFGFNYTQGIPANSYVLDRWWMVGETPMVGSAVPAGTVAVPQPADAGRVVRSGRARRSYSRVVVRPYNRAGIPAASALPTGSLYWPATSGMPLYSPAQRYASYGQGYGVSPYGTADYGALYKGLYWGN